MGQLVCQIAAADMEMQAGHLQAEPPRHLNGIGPLFAIDAEFGRRVARIDQLFRVGIAGSQAGIDADADLAARTPLADAPDHADRVAVDGDPGPGSEEDTSELQSLHANTYA